MGLVDPTPGPLRLPAFLRWNCPHCGHANRVRLLGEPICKHCGQHHETHTETFEE